MNPYSKLVADFARIVAEGRSLPLGGFKGTPRPEIAPDAPKALFFAPHPDDETIQGGLALRLLREAKWNVIDIAVTLGSNVERKAPRWQELRAACDYLGFGLEAAAPDGLANVRPATRGKDQQAWGQMVEIIAALLKKHQPRAIFFPHELDWNGTHIGVHLLVMDALKAAPVAHCYLIETEFWGQMQTPNLVVEYSDEVVADLAAATSFHAGEVRRNPYHLLIPAWMQDNVRRGAELVGGQGGAAPQFMFAQIYRAREWDGSQSREYFAGGRFLPASENPATLFP
ncbi:MAG TPA: PIG-L family deacetylase [Verrucomicrobiae bacterium]|jgi:LmbE family N-acetylglucosaminyl deacetylase|nr:PIG-L family deacetylase [Verrucomicrobiae bacterium]